MLLSFEGAVICNFIASPLLGSSKLCQPSKIQFTMSVSPEGLLCWIDLLFS